MDEKTATDYYKEGLQNLENKQYMKAIGDFTSAVSLEPEFADAYYHRALAKKFFAEEAGFISNELCADLIQAVNFGNQEALPLLENNCMGECSDMNNVSEPENTFCLDLKGIDLVHIPHIADYFTNVVRLDISSNQLIDANEEISQLHNLIYLDLSNNKIKVLAEINSKHLKELNLSYNLLSQLPASIYELKNLKTLYLRNNLLFGLNDLSKLSDLEVLDLSFNKLKKLPENIATLKNLKQLDLMGNTISTEEVAELKKQLPNCEILID